MHIHVETETAELARWRPDWKTKLISDTLELRGGAFIDVGANVGQTFLDYRAATSRVKYIGFEPITICAKQVWRLINDNNCGNCFIIPVALSNSNSILKLYRDANIATDSGATLIADFRPKKQNKVDFIPAYRFDDLWKDAGFSDKIGVIKIDVEGGELMVLQGMRDSITINRPWIICEVLDRDVAADRELHTNRNNDLLDFLDNLAYAVLRLKKSHDKLAVCDLIPVGSFPSRAYCVESRVECDYLFIPREDLDVRALLVSR
ncbi:FkbM family methyltransferase [Sinorhizobium numidicum]|uniref:FkbM family methyltransferase n=1 Tax=Sinorhizobium numidicum TaxID=680248 RepID=A0ABY8CR57_9HYPH|nr:FkbM family methyltransferase [Sinorhizobium numidicum]WEX75105.1 FkbM family methyltransferase [Sinorhizobium numidicum]WEX81099.1 FkbM family methyltransferase [Sinorhizobium numidicum]